MGTFNGEKFLEEQLESLESQTYKNWTLFASDDGSTDQTIVILEKYRQKWGAKKLSISKGPQKGFCQNFLSLTDNLEIETDYYAWADQDDIWVPEKLDQALYFITPYEQNIAALYCGRTILINEMNLCFGLAPRRVIPPPSFSNGLVQSLAGANTMLFNRPARELIRKGLELAPVSHDWWAYQIISGTGGKVIYDPQSTLLYRQHGNNIIGSNRSNFALISRIRKAWNKSFREMNNANINALSQLENELNKNSLNILNYFKNIRHKITLSQYYNIIKNKYLYRRSLFQQFSLYIGILFNKI
jgi:glycosyltransferase involved in cell wall biosynthesis